MSTQDDAALVAKLRWLQSDWDDGTCHALHWKIEHDEMLVLLRLTEEALASRPVVEAARAFIIDGMEDSICGCRYSNLQRAVRDLDRATAKDPKPEVPEPR